MAYTPTARHLFFWHRIAIIVFVLPLLAGCSKREDDGRIHIVYWEKWTGVEAAALQATIDIFNDSQDKIFVELLAVSGIDRKTILATAGGAPPDIAGIWVPQIASWADMNALQPLDEFMIADGHTPEEFMARYEQVYSKICQHDGRVYGLPVAAAAIGLHWNKTLFREAGLDPERPPRNIEELMEFSKKLTKRDPATGALVQVGILPQEPGYWPWAFCQWFGGRLVDEDGNITIGTDPQNLEAMEWIKSYTEYYGVEEMKIFASGFGRAGSPQNPFFAGKVAMMLNGVWTDDYLNQYAPGLDYGAAPYPIANDEVGPYSNCEGDMLVIPRGARHPEEAWEFIKFFANHNPRARSVDELAGGEILWYKQRRNSPLKVWSPYFEQNHPHPYIKSFREMARLPSANHVPRIGIWQEYAREISLAAQRIWFGQAEPADALAYAQKRVSASWEAHKLSVERQRRAGGLPPSRTQAHSNTTLNP